MVDLALVSSLVTFPLPIFSKRSGVGGISGKFSAACLVYADAPKDFGAKDIEGEGEGEFVIDSSSFCSSSSANSSSGVILVTAVGARVLSVFLACCCAI